MLDGPLLALDVGGGTQDVFIWDGRGSIENAVKLVLPAPTQVLGRRLRRLTADRAPVFLTGRLMGGGAITQAVRHHLARGLEVYATPQAALTLSNRLDEVQDWGVILTDAAPPAAAELRLGDFQPDEWRSLLASFEIPFPRYFAVAVQDHGFSPEASGRRFRFQHWENFLAQGGQIAALAYREPPAYLTRMGAIKDTLHGALVMDTCAAGTWGALLDPRAQEHLSQGLMVVNLGNSHTFAALVQSDSLWGIYEHHTGLLTPPKLFDHLARFQAGKLTNDAVFAGEGHGCAYRPGYPPLEPFSLTIITGPRRRLARGWPGVFAAPFGDMMLTGCFGLAAAFLEVEKIPLMLDELL